MAARRIFSAGASSGSGDVSLALSDLTSAPGRARAAVAWLERNSLFVAGLAAVAAAILGSLRLHMNQDAWLALVDGRYVAQHGIPHHDVMTVITHGARWIDQQWLAQLAIYGLHQLGGLALYGIVYIGLTVGAMGMAIAASRRLGGTDAHILWVLPLAAFLYFGGSFEVRTQGFAYPLFVATLYLLAADQRIPSRRVFLVFPLLILWSNLHGSAIIGAGLVALYGVTLLIKDLRERRGIRVGQRGLALTIGAPACLLATPYGLAGAGYYRETLMNPVFKALVTEWRPITSAAALAVPFFVAAFATVWLLGKNQVRARLFEALALLALIAAAISAVRNITWFALAAAILLPPMVKEIAPVRAAAPRRRRINLSLAGSALVALVISAAAVAGKPASWFEHGYDRRALDIITATARDHPGLRIFADVHFGDWLLWHDPALADRVAYDARLELLTRDQLRGLTTLTEMRLPGSHDLLAGYGLFVLENKDQDSLTLMLERTRSHVVLRGHGVTIAAQPGV